MQLEETVSRRRTSSLGTSSSHRSPDTNVWHAVRAAYRSRDIDSARLNALLWRAAGVSAEAQLGKQLAAPEIAQFARIVSSQPDSATALQAVLDTASSCDRPTIGMEIARRAAARAYQVPDRQTAFIRTLFVEATRYLVARDAPSLVGVGDRLRTVRDVIDLKNEVSTLAGQIASQRSLPRRIDSKSWRRLTSAILADLSK